MNHVCIDAYGPRMNCSIDDAAILKDRLIESEESTYDTFQIIKAILLTLLIVEFALILACGILCKYISIINNNSRFFISFHSLCRLCNSILVLVALGIVNNFVLQTTVKRGNYLPEFITNNLYNTYCVFILTLCTDITIGITNFVLVFFYE